MTNEAIAEKMDVSISCVARWIKESGYIGIRKRGRKKKDTEEKKSIEKKTVPAGHNADRHLCKTCIFRPSAWDKSKQIGCNYIEIVGHSRRCAVEDCNVYEKGNPKKK